MKAKARQSRPIGPPLQNLFLTCIFIVSLFLTYRVIHPLSPSTHSVFERFFSVAPILRGSALFFLGTAVVSLLLLFLRPTIIDALHAEEQTELKVSAPPATEEPSSVRIIPFYQQEPTIKPLPIVRTDKADV